MLEKRKCRSDQVREEGRKGDGWRVGVGWGEWRSDTSLSGQAGGIAGKAGGAERFNQTQLYSPEIGRGDPMIKPKL